MIKISHSFLAFSAFSYHLEPVSDGDAGGRAGRGSHLSWPHYIGPDLLVAQMNVKGDGEIGNDLWFWRRNQIQATRCRSINID